MFDKPTNQEINIHNSLDEITASEHFLGLNLKDAEALFVKDSFNYRWDLLWMGSKAFNYYVEAALNYLNGESSNGDVDFVDALYQIFEQRLQRERGELAVEKIVNVIDAILKNYEKFEVNDAIYSNLYLKFKKLRESLI
jgi:hypothetical protein